MTRRKENPQGRTRPDPSWPEGTFVCSDCRGKYLLDDRRRGFVCWECWKERARRWSRENREKANATAREWVKANPDRSRRNKLALWEATRTVVIAHYGSRCTCCGEGEMTFLTIDHVEGGGSAHRREIGYDGIFRVLRAAGYPDGYQVLCRNCNWAKFMGGCPHVGGCPTNGKQKLQALEHYGQVCSCCGEDQAIFLGIHKTGDASIPRGCTGEKRYRLLRQNGWPDGFLTLCLNCGWAAAHDGCPHRVSQPV